MFRLTVIDECSYCLEQSYLLDLVDMVTPKVFMRKDREGYVSITHRLNFWAFLPGAPRYS